MATDQDERRDFGRVPVDMAVILTTDAGETVAGTCRDLSIDGTFICCDPSLMAGTPCRLAMIHNGGQRTVNIQVEGVVARTTPGGLGIRFTAVNAGDTRRIYHVLMDSALID